MFFVFFVFFFDIFTLSLAHSIANEIIATNPGSRRFSFESKLGLDVAKNLAKIRDLAPELQARVWSAMARSAREKFDTVTGYQRAIAIFADAPWKQVDLRVRSFPGSGCAVLGAHVRLAGL